MLTLPAPVTDQVSVVVPSLVIFEGEAAKLAIVGGVEFAGGGDDAGVVGSPVPPPQPSTQPSSTTTAATPLKRV
jgi:hypothetical protein